MKIIGISPHRRNFLRKAVGAAPAVALLAGAGGGLAMAVSKDQPAYKPRFFDATEWATLTALVDRLIPADGEGPGALEAGAHEFIDAQMN
ncbi:gluconate 2-dehydrogenase subunit 3 family protein, partial [Streptococcus danieliae]|nr:gluconate 2-dehydrogenase subunit 3 family protein [Streptococcus danieliae]